MFNLRNLFIHLGEKIVVWLVGKFKTRLCVASRIGRTKKMKYPST